MPKRAKSKSAPKPAAHTPPRPLDVTVLLLDAGYASTAIAPIEVFHSAGFLWNWLHGETQEPRFRVRVASIDGKPVTTAGGVGLLPAYSLADIKHTDIVILPASGWDVKEHIANNTELLPWLRKWHKRGAYVAGICTGVVFLAEAGLLDGRRATTHWGVAPLFRERYPDVLWQTDNFVTEDNRVMCSGGVYASIDLSLYLVEKFCGHEVALQCAKAMLLSMPRSKQSGYAVVPLSRPHSDAQIRKAEDYLRENFDRNVSIETLAEHSGMGARNFIRRFKAATGRLPNAYLQLMRIAAAKEMLERGATSVQSVCSAIGYEDLAFFRSLFKRHTGMTPAEYRDRFGGVHFERDKFAAQSLTA